MRQFKIDFDKQQYTVNYITDTKEAAKVGAYLGKSEIQNFGLDIETYKKADHPKAGLEPHLSGISLVQIFDGKNTVYIFDVLQVGLAFFGHIKHKNFVAHYATFEIKHLSHNGFPSLSVGCSMLLSILVDRAEKTDFVPYGEEDEEEDDKPHWKGYGLDAIIGRLFDVRIDKKFQLFPWHLRPNIKGTDTIKHENGAVTDIYQWNEALVYAALDAILTFKITQIQFPKVKEYKMLKHYSILKDMQHVISDMELNGMQIDADKHAALIHEWNDTLMIQGHMCVKHFGNINLGSTKQLGEWLEKNRPEAVKGWKRTKTGKLGFGKSDLASRQNMPEIKALLAHKKTAKLISTYGTSLVAQVNPVTKRVHCSFTLGETRTGRLSSREPNLQNLPRESSMREIFVPGDGCKLIVADFNQIELRVAGEVSGDPVIRRAYARGDDLHSIFASHIYSVPLTKVTKEQRQIAKSANFGTIYGMGPSKFVTYTLAATDGRVELSEDQARHIINSLWGLYKVYGQWCLSIREEAKYKGFVRTPLGKMRRLHPDETYTKAPNTVVQGGAFEVMAVAMIKCRELIHKNNGQHKCRIINSVHDELILEVKDDPQALKAASQVVEYSMNWGMKHVFPKANTYGLAVAKTCATWGEK